MKLYQDYKEEKEKKNQMEEDREALGLDENTVIIYEKSGFMSKTKNIFILTLLLALLGVGIVEVVSLLIQAGVL